MGVEEALDQLLLLPHRLLGIARQADGGLLAMIHITDAIAIEEREVKESFVRAGGPGGQNVNKLATAVQLRFDIRRSPSLPEDVRVRLEKLAGRRLTQEGVLIITAQRHRTQERNRQDALDRLVALTAGDYFELIARQTSGSTKNVAADKLPWFAIEVVK